MLNENLRSTRRVLLPYSLLASRRMAKGNGFEPKTFEEAVARYHGDDGRNFDQNLVLQVGGPIHCPAPWWNLGETYRIALVGDRPQIQLLKDGKWIAAEVEPPKGVSRPNTPVARAPIARRAASDKMDTKTQNILFMDLSGWSGLKAGAIYTYVTKAMPSLEPILAKSGFLNTWGDAIVATFDGVKDAAEASLKLRDFFRSSYDHEGMPEQIMARVALHSGETLVIMNPLTKRPDIFGHGVHIAARLEPVTEPRHVFCTKSFADRLGEIEGAAPKAWPLGAVELPKGFGTVEVHVLTWPKDDDPIPGIKARRSEKADSPAGAPAAPQMSPADAQAKLAMWLNQLPRDEDLLREFADADSEADVPVGSAKAMLIKILGDSPYWKLDHLGETFFTLKRNVGRQIAVAVKATDRRIL
jgi:class 3 adenylate cyclase